MGEWNKVSAAQKVIFGEETNGKDCVRIKDVLGVNATRTYQISDNCVGLALIAIESMNNTLMIPNVLMLHDST